MPEELLYRVQNIVTGTYVSYVGYRPNGIMYMSYTRHELEAQQMYEGTAALICETITPMIGSLESVPVAQEEAA